MYVWCRINTSKNHSYLFTIQFNNWCWLDFKAYIILYNMILSRYPSMPFADLLQGWLISAPIQGTSFSFLCFFYFNWSARFIMKVMHIARTWDHSPCNEMTFPFEINHLKLTSRHDRYTWCTRLHFGLNHQAVAGWWKHCSRLFFHPRHEQHVLS